MSIDEHKADIDFRNHAERKADATKDFIEWYEQLLNRMLKEGYSDLLQGQLTMLSSVLWYLLDPADYKKLTTSKKSTQAQVKII